MSPNGSPNPSRPQPAGSRRGGFLVPAFFILAVLGAAGAGAYFLMPDMLAKKDTGILLHTVKLEPLPIAIVEKGTLESAENRDVVCKVKAGSKGTYSSTIRWVIDDGSIVQKGQLLIELDDSALQDDYKNQIIAVEKANAEFITADENYRITVKENESLIAEARAALTVAELDLDKFLGFRVEPSLNSIGALTGVHATLVEKGEYKQLLDDVSSRLKQSLSDLGATKERAAWAERSVKLGYLTPTQAKVESTKYASSFDMVEKLAKEKYILENFIRQRDLTDLKSKMNVAKIALEKSILQARSKEVQAESERKTKQSVYLQEVEKLKEVEAQIAECKLYAPQDGMVVYSKPDSGRFSQSQQGLIAQGEQVKEGQKLMRIPDLRKMQVNTKVHEALVSRIRGDDRRPTGFVENLRAAMLTHTDPFARLLTQSEHALTVVREQYRDREYYVANQGMPATVRVDAYPDRIFSGRVRSVAAVASQADWMSSDVKVYQTQVLIDGTVDGLKPDMNAEVTIHIENSNEPVLAVPIQAVVGGADWGPRRVVYVMTPNGPQERDVQLGKFNDKMIEVISGLNEGDQVVINPKAILGDQVKTREPGADSPRSKGAIGGKGGEGQGGEGQNGEGKGGKGKGGKGPPAGKGQGMPTGPQA